MAEMRALLIVAVLASAASADPARKIESAWKRLHANQEVPAPCRQADPVRVLVADVDASPGRETVLASRRWGVVMLDSAGAPLASWPLACGSWPELSDRVLLSSVRASGLSPTDLLVRTRVTGHCGTFHNWTLLRRVGRELATIFETDERRQRSCGMSPREEARARIEVVRLGWIRVTAEGTIAPALGGGDYGTPRWFRGVSDWHLRDGRFVEDHEAAR